MMEGCEEARERAYAEIHEETGIYDARPVVSCMPVRIPGHDIVIHPYVFFTCITEVRLNSENDAYTWIRTPHLAQYETVPYLADILLCLLGSIYALAGQHDIHTCTTAHCTGDVVAWMLAGTGVYTGSLLGVYGEGQLSFPV